MTILILSSTEREKNPYDAWFSNSKEEIILFCPKEKYETFNIKDYLYIEAFNDYFNNEEVEKRVLELSNKYHFTHILSISEFDVIRSTKLRKLLNLPGQALMSAECYRNKVLMKEKLKNSSVNIPLYEKVSSKKQVFNFISKIGYPIVIKPISGSGSMGVTIAQDANDIEDFFNTHSNDYHLFEVEEYIQGEMYHIDGLIKNNGIIFSSVSHYYNNCLEFQENQPLSSYMLEEKNPLYNRFIEQVNQVIHCLPQYESGSFHAEFFVTQNNDIYLCEIASRTGGGEISKSIEHSTGLVMNQCSFYLQLGYNIAEVPKKNKYSGFVLLPPKVGQYKGILEELNFDWVVVIKNKAKVGQEYTGAKNSVDYIISVIIEGINEKELINRINIVIDWYNDNVQWIS